MLMFELHHLVHLGLLECLTLALALRSPAWSLTVTAGPLNILPASCLVRF